MHCIKDAKDFFETVVRFRLDDNDGKTRVRFEQDNWKETNDFYAACNFTWGRFLVSLRDYCEKGKGVPFE
ncbi:MAG: ATPase [Mucilaginibacter sp.]|nr:ATPase [Mucilaginibacter sp.]